MNEINEFFDKLGAVARKAAGTVSTEVSIAAQEQKIRESYQALGKLCYKAHKNGTTPAGGEYEEHFRRIDACLKRIELLRDNRNVTVDPTPDPSGDVTADETDFVIIEE